MVLVGIERFGHTAISVAQESIGPHASMQMWMWMPDVTIAPEFETHGPSLDALQSMALANNPTLPSAVLMDESEQMPAPMEWDMALSQLLATSAQIIAMRQKVRHDQIVIQREIAEPTPNLLLGLTTGYNAKADQAVTGVTAGLFQRGLGHRVDGERCSEGVDIENIGRLGGFGTDAGTLCFTATSQRLMSIDAADPIFGFSLEAMRRSMQRRYASAVCLGGMPRRPPRTARGRRTAPRESVFD